MTTITKAEEQLEKLISVWDESSSLQTAIQAAGYETTDPRRWHRLRRAAEQY